MPVNSYCVPVTRGLSTGWPAPNGGEDRDSVSTRKASQQR